MCFWLKLVFNCLHFEYEDRKRDPHENLCNVHQDRQDSFWEKLILSFFEVYELIDCKEDATQNEDWHVWKDHEQGDFIEVFGFYFEQSPELCW